MHQVFISHCSADRVAAGAICAALEKDGLRCWIAPRDIQPGSDWADAIMAGIAQVRLLLLVHSAETSASQMVRREANLAVDSRTPIMPVRIDPALPQDAMQFLLSGTHWFDAVPGPLAGYLPRIVASVRHRLVQPDPPPGAPHPGLLQPAPQAVFADRPAIAVLPFQGASANAADEQIAEGLTDDLIAAVSAWRSLPVISRGSVYAQRAQGGDVRMVGRLLGARYVISGVLRHRGATIRLTVELVDVETGAVLLAEQFDRTVADLLALHEEIVLAIASILAPEVYRHERDRAASRPRATASAHDLLRRGLWHRNRATREDHAEAESLFQQAIAAQPGYAEALAALSICRNFAAIRRWTDDVPAAFRESLDYARRAMAADPRDPQSHFAVGVAEMNLGQRDAAMAALREAIRLNPSHSAARANLGQMFNYLNRPAEALPELEMALRLNPHGNYRYQSLPYLAASHYLSGRYRDCLAAAEQALAANPEYPLAVRYAVAALGQLGRPRDAKAMLPIMRRVDSSFANLEAMTKRLFVAEAAAHLLAGFRKAGFE